MIFFVPRSAFFNPVRSRTTVGHRSIFHEAETVKLAPMGVAAGILGDAPNRIFLPKPTFRRLFRGPCG